MAEPPADTRPLLCFAVTEDWYFASHRLVLAREAIARGYRVVLLARRSEAAASLEADGIQIVELDYHRGSINPLHAVSTFLGLLRCYRSLGPELVHQVALQPVIFGTLAARLSGVPVIINALGGLGFLNRRKGSVAGIARFVARHLLSFVLKQPGVQTIVQNPEDHDHLVKDLGVPAQQVVSIPGAGVDENRFRDTPEPGGMPRFTMVSRMLWDKGIDLLVEAIRRLRKEGIDFQVQLVGEPDPENANAIPAATLEQWNREGLLDWRGYEADVPGVWAAAHVCVLPSRYGEGIPKSLIEAAACGRPIITTDHPGCREIVVDGWNGLLVPVDDAQALAKAMRKLAGDNGLRRDMGRRGRERFEAGYTEKQVVDQTFAVYVNGGLSA